MDLQPTFKSLKQTLEPNGVLAILGCYRESTVADLLWSMLAVPVNLAYKRIKRLNSSTVVPEMVIEPPTQTIRDVKTAADELLPNHTFRRHLFWRYSIVWTNCEMSS